jgi:hypothetical protein
VIRQIKSRKMRWAGHVALMVKERKAYKVLVGKSKGKTTWKTEVYMGGCEQN